MSRKTGSSAAQRSRAWGQRVRNRQPEGGSSRIGQIRAEKGGGLAALTRQRRTRGAAASRARV